MKNIYRSGVATLLTLFLTSFSYAQSITSDAGYRLINETLQSKVLSEKRDITVQLPKSYATTPDRHYPVIYRLDGASNIQPINTVLESLQSQNAAPEVIIVAIENTDRLRDLYPNANNDPLGPLGLGGGGAKFLQFFTTELMPYIESKFRVHDYRIISGASAAGVFSLYALQQKPELFDATIAYSAAVWWAYGASAKATVDFVSKQKIMNHYLYTAIGNEGAPMRSYYDDMISGIAENIPTGLRWVNDSFKDVTHNLVSSAGIFRAYHNLFLSEFMTIKDYNGKLSSIEDYYRRLSSQRGTAIKPPEWVIRELGYHFVGLKDFEQALALFKYDTSRYPSSPEAFNGLAYGYEQSGQYQSALVQVNKALALASKDHYGYQVFVNRRERLTKLIRQPSTPE